MKKKRAVIFLSLVALFFICLVLQEGDKNSPDLDAISSVCLVVEENHPKVGGDFNLQFEEMVREILGVMGLDVEKEGEPCDVNFTITLKFKPFEAYVEPHGINCYVGSEASGWAYLEGERFNTLREELYGDQFETVIPFCYGNTALGIYRDTKVEVILEAMVNIWGERAVIALLEQSSWGESFRELFDQDILLAEEVVPMFVSALNNENEEVQLHALDILGFVTSGREETKEEVKEILRGMDGIVDLLLDKVQPGNQLKTRKKAAGLLAKLMIEPERVVPIMITLLDEEDEELRINAMISLGNFGSDSAEAIPALEALLNDPSEEIREEAEWALEKIR